MTTGQSPKTIPVDEAERVRIERAALREIATAQGPGMVGLLSGELMRYSQFVRCFMVVDLPPGTRPFHDPGLDIAGQCNRMIQAARQAGSEWLWIIADDHIFLDDIVLRLLAREVDVVVPFCLQRTAPFWPVLYRGEEDGHHKIVDRLPKHGLAEVYAAGSAGMLIRKNVIDALPELPFTTTGEHHNEDLEFCRRIREADFKIHADMDTRLGHIGVMWCIPGWHESDKLPNGAGWGVKLTIGPTQEMDLYWPAEGNGTLAAL